MESNPLLFYIILGLFIPIGFIFAGITRRRDKAITILKSLKGKYALEHDHYGNILYKVGKITTEITSKTNGNSYETEIIADYTRMLQSPFTITKENNVSTMKKNFGIDDILTHDTEFDTKMLLDAEDESFLVALLSDRVRNSLLKISECVDSMIMTDNYIHLHFKDEYSYKHHILKMDPILYHITIILQMVQKKSFIIDNLIHNINTDTNDEVAYNNFKSLITHYIDDKKVKAFIPEAFTLDNQKIQIEASRFMGDKGMEFLKALSLNIPMDQKEELLRIITILKENKYVKAIPQLKSLLSSNEDFEICNTVLQAFKYFSDTTLSEYLVNLFSRSKTKLQLAALSALTTCGDMKAIEVLFNHSRKIINPVLKTRINETIAAIQSKSGIVDTGHVSIPDTKPESGSVSVNSDDEKGTLSIN